jgi:rRNA biogenesis protein RRP5
MSLKKRKIQLDSLASKVANEENPEHASKRQRKSEHDPSKTKSKVSGGKTLEDQGSHTGRDAMQMITNEGKVFPRGGASALTPLEHKQIQVQAVRDVLFEQQSTNKRGARSTVDSEDEATEPDDSRRSHHKKRKKKSATMGSSKARADLDPKVKIESLTFRKLVPGSIVLGQVSQITSHDIALALPNNLTGYVPITAISEQYLRRVEKFAQDDDNETIADDGQEDDLELDKIVHIGQYLRGYVVSKSDEALGSSSGKKRIELSLFPTHVNTGIRKDDLVPHCMLQASVASVEDHGVVMDLGLENSSVRGFISSKDLDKTSNVHDLEEGAVMLCTVTGTSSNGRVVKLSSDLEKTGRSTKHCLRDAPSVNLYLPGVLAELSISRTEDDGIVGTIMSMIDATSDAFHSGALLKEPRQYKVGNKVMARITHILPRSDQKKVGVSLLPHIIQMSAVTTESDPLVQRPLSSIVEQTKITKILPGMGLILDMGVDGVPGFAHISRIADKKIDTLSSVEGPYQQGSSHNARVLGFNSIDRLFLVSLQESVLQQRYLRLEDVAIGTVVRGKIQKFVFTQEGAAALLIALADGITGYVPQIHFADIHLQHPERKFKEGLTVKCRVLDVDTERRRITLTLKSSLVNSDKKVFSDWNDLDVGDNAPGTIVKVNATGAEVRFYGNVKGWLHVSEMSEAFIADPVRDFPVGKVVDVWILSVDPSAHSMKLSCRDPSSLALHQRTAFNALHEGDIVQALVQSKTEESLTVELDGGVKGQIVLGHFSDGSLTSERNIFKRIRTGQKLENLVVLQKRALGSAVYLSSKPSLVLAAREGILLQDFEDANVGMRVHGFVKNIISDHVFVEFGSGLVGSMFKSQMTDDMITLPDYGLRQYQSLTTTISHVDPSKERIWLSMKSGNDNKVDSTVSTNKTKIVEPVDERLVYIEDLIFGKEVKVRVRSIKSTQLNVQLGQNLQGRVDMSEAYSTWDQIADPKAPLKAFQPHNIITTHIIGMHDARNHRFLPITHRQGRVPVFELSAKANFNASSVEDLLTINKIEVGSTYTVFVNNFASDYMWVNLSPSIRGRIRRKDLSDDVAIFGDMENVFPIGSALQATVKNKDAATGHITLEAVRPATDSALTLETAKENSVVKGRVVKTSDRYVVVQLSKTLAGIIPLTEIADNYDEAKPLQFKHNDFINVKIIKIEKPNKKIILSSRPSLVLDSSLKPVDRQIKGISQLNVNDIVRGFIRNVVVDKGLWVDISPFVTAFVRISESADTKLADWTSAFQVDQLVKGKVIKLDPLQLSLKESRLNVDFVQPLTLDDFKQNQIVTGKVRKVEPFGVFIIIDGSDNVSGLCHRTQMSDEAEIEDARTLYEVGDIVKAKIISIQRAKGRINFSLKASHFKIDLSNEGSDDEGNQAIDSTKILDMTIHRTKPSLNNHAADELSNEEMVALEAINGNQKSSTGLMTVGFDWTGLQSDSEDLETHNEHSHKRQLTQKVEPKLDVYEDKTGELDAFGPQSVADYERILLSEPHNSLHWISYMAFQLNLNEVTKARDIAKRALRTIDSREEEEKLEVRIALLNLENEFGSDISLDDAFKEACQYHDERRIHDAMIGGLIGSGKHEVSEP